MAVTQDLAASRVALADCNARLDAATEALAGAGGLNAEMACMAAVDKAESECQAADDRYRRALGLGRGAA